MRKSVHVLMVLLAIGITFGCATVSFGQEEEQPVGGYSKVATDNADVVAVAEFAVSARKEKQGGPLSLVSIKRAQRQVVAGTNYMLCLEVKAGDETDAGVESQDVQVVVWNTLTRRGEKKKYELTSWKEANCGKSDSEQNHYTQPAASVAGVHENITMRMTAAHAQAEQKKIVVFQTVYEGPPNYSGDVIIGTEPAGGYYQRIAFVPFKVNTPAILGGVIMPMKGRDMIVQLATGPDVPADTGRGNNIPEPKVILSKQLPGNTPFALHDIPIPGNYQLVPGQQYFLMLSAADLGSFAGTWTGDYRAQDRVGGRARGQWFVSPGNHPGALSLVIYGTPVP